MVIEKMKHIGHDSTMQNKNMVWSVKRTVSFDRCLLCLEASRLFATRAALL